MACARSARARMRLENALARKLGDVSFDNEVLILDQTIVERVGEVFRHRVFERFFAEETSREKISRRCSQSSVNTGYSALAAGTSTVR